MKEYQNITGNRCVVLSCEGKKKSRVFRCQMTKGVTTEKGIIFHVQESIFKKTWHPVELGNSPWNSMKASWMPEFYRDKRPIPLK